VLKPTLFYGVNHTLFVDEKAKVGTLCPALDISALNGASVNR
jgi:hypothetical protein